MNELALCAGNGGMSLGLRLAVPEARTVCMVEREGVAAADLVSKMHSQTGTDAELRTSDGSGLTSIGSSVSASRGWSSLKMSMGLWQEDLEPSCATLPEEGTMQDGVVDLAQRPLVPRIEEGGSSCWRPTLTASWPTATARDHRSIFASEKTHGRNSRPLSEVAGLQALERTGHKCQSISGRYFTSLQPNFVEWLMGLPIGWTGSTASDHSATEWSHWWWLMRSSLSKLRGPKLKHD